MTGWQAGVLYWLFSSRIDKLEKKLTKNQTWADFLNSMSIDELDEYLKKETSIPKPAISHS